MNATDQELNIRFRISALASTDEDFRQRLIADARGAIKADFGILVADGAQISVVEEAAQHVTIVLPNRAEDEDAELAEVSGFAAPRAAGMPSMSIFARNVPVLTEAKAPWQQAPSGYEVTGTEGGK